MVTDMTVSLVSWLAINILTPVVDFLYGFFHRRSLSLNAVM